MGWGGGGIGSDNVPYRYQYSRAGDVRKWHLSDPIHTGVYGGCVACGCGGWWCGGWVHGAVGGWCPGWHVHGANGACRSVLGRLMVDGAGVGRLARLRRGERCPWPLDVAPPPTSEKGGGGPAAHCRHLAQFHKIFAADFDRRILGLIFGRQLRRSGERFRVIIFECCALGCVLSNLF